MLLTVVVHGLAPVYGPFAAGLQITGSKIKDMSLIKFTKSLETANSETSQQFMADNIHADIHNVVLLTEKPNQIGQNYFKMSI